MNLEELGIELREIETYYEKNELRKKLEKELKPLNKKIKTKMLANGLTSLIAGRLEVVISEQDRSELDHEKAVAFLKDKLRDYPELLEKIIVVKEQVDEEALEKLFYDGIIEPKSLESCIRPNIVYTLNVKPLKE